ncbi:MAG: N-acetyltransferase [Caldilineaceae bacterium]|nr:N-acetyltransferase [Caldilineaceae bacterium]
MTAIFVHPTAEVSLQATIGQATKVWHHAQIREGAVIGEECIIGRDVYVDADVRIGCRVKIQNSALIYRGVTLADGVFVGPRACLTNDRYPRAITPGGMLKGIADWEQGEIVVGYGASIGAGAVIVTGVTIGAFAMIGAGAVVTHDVPPHGMVVGVPARLVGFVCACGKPLSQRESSAGTVAANGHVETNTHAAHGTIICPTCAAERGMYVRHGQ